ncbi:DUF5716 family protein [Anaeromicropila populeti]|uniref:DUF5716 domain-containing protein n=1 Tax=Anaeromicropila populeti TaxID=37658 RepID=A0A1I6KL95_9FIRM|nr:DUF5716 family protein [Anaeromicropila populeti]SFR91981.1 hypothetical protein SAMN05661086_02508 [Anaeromicropila populeti]
MFKIDNQTLYVGFDLCNEFTQISCYDEKAFEPKSLSLYTEKEVFLIPTVLAVKKETGEWFYGENAISYGNREGVPVLTDFIQKIQQGETIVYLDKTFSYVEILNKFFRKSLSLLKFYFPSEAIHRMVITVSDMNEVLVNAIYAALEELGIGTARCRVISHRQSYIYYALSQKKELWMNDVGLFDYNENGLTFYRIFINRRFQPQTIGIEEKSFRDTISYEMYPEFTEEPEKAYIFESIAKSVLHKRVVTTIYVTGKGFEGSWANWVLEDLCVGRRIFIGHNLYTVGACYGAKEMDGNGKLKNYVILGEEMTYVEVSIRVYKDTKMERVLLVEAGIPWMDAHRMISVIEDDETELEIEVYSMIDHVRTNYFLHIDPIEGRPNRTTRLEVQVQFLERKTFLIKVKDKGFGDFYPSTNRVWEKEIHL